MQDEERRTLVNVLLKVVGVAVAVGLVIGLGAVVMVKALGFSDNTPSAHSTVPADSASPSALPTVALSSPGATNESSAPAEPSSSAPGPKKHKKAIQLSATPSQVAPGGRINLTGRYVGQDNLALQVQRKEAGSWTPFADVQATVRVGTFATYVLTSRSGDNVFRVLDPTTGKASNPVTVTVS